jgi:hypothetical protein
MHGHMNVKSTIYIETREQKHPCKSSTQHLLSISNCTAHPSLSQNIVTDWFEPEPLSRMNFALNITACVISLNRLLNYVSLVAQSV